MRFTPGAFSGGSSLSRRCCACSPGSTTAGTRARNGNTPGGPRILDEPPALALGDVRHLGRIDLLDVAGREQFVGDATGELQCGAVAVADAVGEHDRPPGLDEREGIAATQFPQTDVRMIPASDRLYRAIVEKRLTIPDNDELRQHAASATARRSRRGWRIDKLQRADNIDGIISLCMALDAVEAKPEPVELLGWL